MSISYQDMAECRKAFSHQDAQDAQDAQEKESLFLSILTLSLL
jgi:hypothetical protein